MPDPICTARENDCRKEVVVNNEKLKIAYERLSRDDEAVGDSLSIQNQKMLLEDYATRHGYNNLTHIVDDGWSGTRWDRPGIVRLIDEVERGNVELCLVKDMSRLGRDHLRVGLLLEQFSRDRGVRFIAINDNVDTARNDDDFTPFRNIINEWVARDTSRKIRAINDARTKDGKHVTGAVPYGYLRDPNEKSRWLLDEEAALIVRRIFNGIIHGKTVTKIADELTAEGVLIPTAHWQKVNAGMRSAPNANPTRWSAGTIITILQKEEYMGWCVLNKTVKETYKSKRKPAPDNRLIFKDAHLAIVDEETWTIVQRLRGTKRRVYKLDGEPYPLTGVLFCADCGHKMYHKQGSTGRDGKPHHEYVCTSYRHYSRTCTCHYIRVPVVENLILDAIRRVSGYVRKNEAKFIERVRKESALQQDTAVKESRRKLTQSQRRRDEINGLIKKLYESYAADKIPEKHFTELLTGYDAEQTSLENEIINLQAEIDAFNSTTVNIDKFIELVKRHTEFTEFSPGLLNEFIEKVIVHEAVKVDGVRTQDIEIFFAFIGKFDVPEVKPAPAQKEIPVLSRGRTPRHLMTEEERNREREADHRYYARKVAAKKAAEQAERAEILQGTSYAKAI